MGQIFHPRANSFVTLSLAGGLIALIVLVTAAALAYRSPFQTRVGVPLEQPVPFSHQHHVQGLGIDCRYCHATVEDAAFAGMPSTRTCMTCHSQIWTNSPMLAPVRESFERSEPLRWNRVHNLPDFVFFDHSLHVQRGIGCATCHGAIESMPLVRKANELYMRWCLDCHRDPHAFAAGKNDPGVPLPDSIAALHQQIHLPADFKTPTPSRAGDRSLPQLQDCSICHH